MLDLAGEVRRIQNSGRRVIDLSLGQPEVPAPPHVVVALREALRTQSSSYGAATGDPELRALIAEQCTKASQTETKESEIVVTSGSKHALFVAMLTLLDSGDEVVVPEPYFPPYAEIAALVGARLKTVPVTWTPDRVSLEVEEFLGAATRRTRVMLLNYPNNPAGWTLESRDVRKIAEFCSDKGIYLVSDEIYDKIVFDGRVHCPAWTFSQGTNSVIGIGSFSKTYSMIPYRLGYLVAKSAVAREVLKVVRATVTMVSPYVQRAGCAALTGPQDFVSARLLKYQERRDRCVRELREDGIGVPSPQGAFYLFFRLPERIDATKFVSELLSRDGVAVLPGAVFGTRWSSFVRVSFGTADRDLTAGLRKFVKRYLSN